MASNAAGFWFCKRKRELNAVGCEKAVLRNMPRRRAKGMNRFDREPVDECSTTLVGCKMVLHLNYLQPYRITTYSYQNFMKTSTSLTCDRNFTIPCDSPRLTILFRFIDRLSWRPYGHLGEIANNVRQGPVSYSVENLSDLAQKLIVCAVP